MRRRWTTEQSDTTYSSVSFPSLHFPHMVLTGRPFLCSQYLAVATFQTTHRRLQFRFFSAVKLFSIHALHSANLFHGRFPPSCSTPDGDLRKVVVVSDVLLIGCSSFSGLFVCHLISTWPPGEGNLVPLIVYGSKEV